LDETRVPAIMIQGTGSGVGKSTLVAGLARAFTRRGLRVQPFKPQNMSNNAAVTGDGGEIGRAQALQARAAGIAPSIHMNPVLLKPETDRGAQIIVQGRSIGRASAADYAKRKIELLPAVLESFRHLEQDADLVLVEGAGSPAEINLRANDIANMGFANAADLPVIIAGDIDRGGVIASLAGTHAVLAPEDRDRIKGFLINKFRGDPSLFQDGIEAISRITSWPSLGLIPFLPATASLPAEDSLDLARRSTASKFKIAVPALARIANFDDLDPLSQEPDVELIFVPPGSALPGDTDLVILPGSKSTMGDLAFLREQGWHIDIAAHVRRGGHVLGLCGGYQMLGLAIEDLDGVDGVSGRIEGLGLLSVETRMAAEKRTTPVLSATHCLTGAQISGYEIHLGATQGSDCARPMLMIEDRPDGATSPDGRVQGTYVHGLFSSDSFRKQWLAGFGIASQLAYEAQMEAALDALADHLETHADLDAILKIAQSR
jgi:adenosylcobyric acid synthase